MRNYVLLCHAHVFFVANGKVVCNIHLFPSYKMNRTERVVTAQSHKIGLHILQELGMEEDTGKLLSSSERLFSKNWSN